LLNEINRRLAAEADAAAAADLAAGRPQRPPIFLGLLYATFDIATRELRYANADLPALVLRGANRHETLNDSGGPAIGMLPGLLYTEGVATLAAGDTLLLFTDGLTEARNLGRVEFGVERIAESLAQPHLNATEAVARIAADVRHFVGSAGRHDDLTVLALHFAPRSSADPREMKSNRCLTIKSHPRHLAEVRQYVRRMAAEAGVSEETTFKLVLAVDEAVTNIIRHAYGGDEDQEISLRSEHTPDTLEFRLRDFGRQADPDTFKSRELSDVRPGGLGCHFMEQGFDTVAYETNLPRGTELRLVKRLVR
jgi:anti-sigma regulatory factor (Ser/Thr protein kinase)